MPVLCREGLGPHWTPSWALTGHALHTKGHPCCHVVTAHGAQIKGNTAKIGVLLMGSKEGATQDVFAAHLGTRLESAEASWSCRQAFVPKSHANAGSNWEGCWRGDTASQSSGCHVLPIPCAEFHPSSSSPRLCCCWDMGMVFLSSSALMSSFV